MLSSSRLCAVSTTLSEETFTEEAVARPISEVVPWIGLLAALALVVGGLSAVFWANVVDLPTYRILADGSATVSERALTQFVASDAWFVICGAFVGLGLGIVTWRWFKPLGWPTALLAAGAGLMAAVVCWLLGQLLGPGSFEERLATASPDDLVPVSLQLRSWSALAVWPFAAVAPVLLASALGPEDAPPRRGRRQPEPVPIEEETVDERGVVTAVSSPVSPR